MLNRIRLRREVSRLELTDELGIDKKTVSTVVADRRARQLRGPRADADDRTEPGCFAPGHGIGLAIVLHSAALTGSGYKAAAHVGAALGSALISRDRVFAS